MITINIDKLKDNLPKTYVTLSTRGLFSISVTRRSIVIENNSKTVEYPLKNLNQAIVHIIQTRSILIPENWHRITEQKNDFY